MSITKVIKSYFSCYVIKSYFAYFQRNSIRKPLEQSKISSETTISLGLSCILQTTYLDTTQMLVKT